MRPRSILLLALSVCLAVVAVSGETAGPAATSAAAHAAAPHAAAAAPPAPPVALLQSKSKTYSASRARASLHAGEHASTNRFHSTLHRAGVDAPRRAQSHRHAARQDHSRLHQQQVMLDIVEKVLRETDKREAVAPQMAGGADPAAEAASEFHLLNSLMEAQSSIRATGQHSNEKEKIGGVDRHFLQSVTDKAVANALRLVAKEHPGKPMHRLSEPLHLYGVRKLWTPKEAAPTKLHHNPHARHSLYSAEALADPYLSRNTHMDTLTETSSFAHRISPQMVYRLSDSDRAALAHREQVRNKEYAARHKAHQLRRKTPTPKPSRAHKTAAYAAHAKAHPAEHPAPRRAPASSPAAAAGYPGAFLEEEVEIDDSAAFLAVQEQYAEELGAHPHHVEEYLQDSAVAQEPLSSLLGRFSPERVDPTMMVELDSSLESNAASEHTQMPLRELGILLGLNPNKENKQPVAAAAAAPTPAPAKVPAAAAHSSAPAAPAAAHPMRFAQGRTRSRDEPSEDAPADAAPAEGEVPAEGAAPEAGAEAGGGDAAAGAGGAEGGDFEAMVNAGEEYQPSSLKHPPPPPVPPPPPPPAPPKFD